MKSKDKSALTDATELTPQVEDLLYQALETELGGVEVYREAILCARNSDLKKEWKKYLGETEEHVEIVQGVFEDLGMDTEVETPGRSIVRDKGQALVAAMRKAREEAPDAAQIVAAECVVDAESKDHRNWELIGGLAAKLGGEAGKALKKAYEKVEDEEDEHLYHTMGWCRELWLEAIGLDAQLPPLEEKRDVKTGIGEAKIAAERKSTVKKAAKASNGKAKVRPAA